MAQIRKHARIALGIVAAGTAGTAILFGPASAAQAKSVNWDAVAHCESGGNWGTSTGNGYYGGLQFSRSTWKAHGGGKYAGTANKASRAEQIKIAEKVLHGQGIGAWPTCGNKGGSSRHHKAHTATFQSVHKSAKHGWVKHRSVKHGWVRHGSVKHGWVRHGWVRHGSVRHGSVEHGSVKHRATTHAMKQAATAKVVRATGVTYVVRSGDTLATIAARHAVKGGWHTLYQLNQSKIGSNPNLIWPGQVLSI